MKLFFATTNANKVPGAAQALAPFGIEVVQRWLDIPELQAETAAEVAAAKVKYAFSHVAEPVMVIDSAFHIPALGGEKGFPGPNVKWAARQLGPGGFLRLMSHLPDPANRVCWFEDALACARHADEPVRVFTRRVMGTLAPAVSASPAQPWAKSVMWRVFIPDGFACTLADMSPEEFAVHRASVRSYYEDFGRWFSGG